MRNDRETRLEEARERSLIYSSSEILVLTIRFRSSEYLSFEIMPILLCLHMLLGSAVVFLYLFLLFLNYIQGGVHKGQGNWTQTDRDNIIQGTATGNPHWMPSHYCDYCDGLSIGVCVEK